MTTSDPLTALRAGRLVLKVGHMELQPGLFRWSVRYYPSDSWIRDTHFAAEFAFQLPNDPHRIRIPLRDVIPVEVYDDEE